MNFSDLLNSASPYLTTATEAYGGYEHGDAQAKRTQNSDALTLLRLKRQREQDGMTDAMHASQLRSKGYVPDAERGPDVSTALDGPSMDRLSAIASGGFSAPGANIGHPDAQAPRYGASTGGFSYDTQSPAAQAEGAKIGASTALARLRNQQAEKLRARMPSSDVRQKFVDAGNDAEDVDAALSTGDPAALRRLLQPDATETHATNRDYDVSHPLPSRAAGRAGSATAELPAHRNARQALNAVRGQSTETQHEIRDLDKSAPPLVQFPGIVTGTAADSAQARQFSTHRQQLQQRADSLRTEGDQLSGQLTSAAHGSRNGDGPGSAVARATPLPPLTPTQMAKAKVNPEYKQFLTEKGYSF